VQLVLKVVSNYCFTSTAHGEEISRIVCHLSKGQVSLPREVMFTMSYTEYGTAYLHGKNVQERALALLSIASPKFRENF
jgi:acyl-CoA hydrolase